MQTNKTRADSVKSRPAATNGKNPTTTAVRGATNRRPLTPDQRGRFWVSVGEAIEAAQTGRAS